jgi:hypothetical protein
VVALAGLAPLVAFLCLALFWRVPAQRQQEGGPPAEGKGVHPDGQVHPLPADEPVESRAADQVRE